MEFWLAGADSHISFLRSWYEFPRENHDLVSDHKFQLLRLHLPTSSYSNSSMESQQMG
jgi:hypothetical protein